MNATVEQVVAGGYGLLRTPEGIVFARAVLPGEVIDTGPLVKRRGVMWAETPRILEPSPDRIEPACRYFPVCGGCDFHHATRAVELELKRRSTEETLRRVSGAPVAVAVAEGMIELTPELEYRNNIRIQGGAGYLGFCEKGSHRIVDIEDCAIASPAIRAGIRKAREAALRDSPKCVTLRSGTDGALTTITTSHGRTHIEGGALTLRLADRDYRVSPHSFFQVNTAAAGLIIRDLRAFLPRTQRLVDLFAGVGTFALALADLYPKVLGCEIARSAVDDFRANAAGMSNVRIETWDAAKGLKTTLGPDDVLIVDPPRTGLPERLVDALTTPAPANARPRALAYVSCDPATFARDLKSLGKGGWRLPAPVRLYDMFPRTAHAELMGILTCDEEQH